MKFSQLTASLVICSFAALFTACARNQVIDPTTDQGIVSVGQVDIQDFKRASNELATKLLKSPVLAKYGPDNRAVMAVSLIENRTSTQLETDLLIKDIRTALLNSGKVYTTTAVSVGASEDPLVRDARNLRKDDEFDQSTIAAKGTLKAPDFTLSGKIIGQNVRDGHLRQSTYTFQLSLSDTKTGLEVWGDSCNVTKQGRHNTVGW